MTHDAQITCPKCKHEFKLTDSLAAPLLAAEQARHQAALEAEKARADRAVVDAASKASGVEAEVARRVAEVRAVAVVEAANANSEELATMRTKLAEAQTAQAEFLRKSRQIDDAQRELQLTIEKQVAEQINAARQRAYNDAEENARLKLLEKENLLHTMQTKVAELQQRIEQGSQQLQGEIQELDLEATLKAEFPFDQISEVGKGVNGADITQVVVAPSGAVCGTILWESKRTKTFSAGWLPKLRDDLRSANADIPVIVTQAMPKDVEGFGQLDGVWVCQPTLTLPIAAILRDALLRVHAVKSSQEGLATKAELLYAYLVGKQFKHRVEAIVESFTTMSSDLDAEKKAITRAWAKRSQQIETALTATAGMFGDIQGVGAAVPEIEVLSMKELGA